MNVIENDDDDDRTRFRPDNSWQEGDTSLDNSSPEETRTTPNSIEFNFPTKRTQVTHNNQIPIVDDEDDETEPKLGDEALLLRYHQQFGHVSFARLKDMARTGAIPKRLAQCNTPVCAACLYSKATRLGSKVSH